MKDSDKFGKSILVGSVTFFMTFSEVICPSYEILNHYYGDCGLFCNKHSHNEVYTGSLQHDKAITSAATIASGTSVSSIGIY